MLSTPTKYALVAGFGEGESKLAAFDLALLNAGIGNVNLLKVSSILPPHAEMMDTIQIPPGSLVPVAYGTLASDISGTLISAAIAIGLNGNNFGIIMEHTAFTGREEAESTIRKMIGETFRNRGLAPTKVIVKAVDHKVESIGCVFAGAVLWY